MCVFEDRGMSTLVQAPIVPPQLLDPLELWAGLSYGGSAQDRALVPRTSSEHSLHCQAVSPVPASFHLNFKKPWVSAKHDSWCAFMILRDACLVYKITWFTNVIHLLDSKTVTSGQKSCFHSRAFGTPGKLKTTEN